MSTEVKEPEVAAWERQIDDNIARRYRSYRTFHPDRVRGFGFEEWYQSMGYREDEASICASLLGVTPRYVRDLRKGRYTPSEALIHQCLSHSRMVRACGLAELALRKVEGLGGDVEAVVGALNEEIGIRSTYGWMGSW